MGDLAKAVFAGVALAALALLTHRLAQLPYRRYSRLRRYRAALPDRAAAMALFGRFGYFLVAAATVAVVLRARPGDGAAPMIAGSFVANFAFATLVPGLWIAQRVRPELFGLRLAGTRRSLTWGVAQFIAWTPWIYAVNFAVRALLATPPETQHPLVDVIRGKEGVSLAILGFLVGCVAAPLGEEVTFRAALQGWLLRRLSGWPSIALSACVFAGLHSANWPDPIPLFGFGLLLGWIYHQTRSLPTVVVLHALFNLIATAAAYFSG